MYYRHAPLNEYTIPISSSTYFCLQSEYYFTINFTLMYLHFVTLIKPVKAIKCKISGLIYLEKIQTTRMNYHNSNSLESSKMGGLIYIV